jgi:hypothetical protein
VCLPSLFLIKNIEQLPRLNSKMSLNAEDEFARYTRRQNPIFKAIERFDTDTKDLGHLSFGEFVFLAQKFDVLAEDYSIRFFFHIFHPFPQYDNTLFV